MKGLLKYKILQSFKHEFFLLSLISPPPAPFLLSHFELIFFIVCISFVPLHIYIYIYIYKYNNRKCGLNTVLIHSTLYCREGGKAHHTFFVHTTDNVPNSASWHCAHHFFIRPHLFCNVFLNSEDRRKKGLVCFPSLLSQYYLSNTENTIKN